MSDPAVVHIKGRQPLVQLVGLALRLLRRDWLGGELQLLFLALLMAVTSVTGIALFTDRLEKALILESANMLAADRVLSSRREPPRAILAEAATRGLRTAETLSFTSMAFSDSGNLLVAAKAVSADYPLRGELIVTDALFTRGRPVGSGPPPGEVWLESRGLPALNLELGDRIYVGEAELTVGQILIAEPDRSGGDMIDNAGPRLMLNLADVPATNVVQTGSRVSYRYLFAADELTALDDFESWVESEFERDFYIRDIREESEEVREALDRAESFLLLGSLFAVLLAGLAIALTARRYSERHFDYVAILKTLGCTSGQISILYLTIQLALAALAIAAGWVLGWLVHQGILQLLGSILQVELPPAGLQPYLVGALTALVCLLAFALPPLLALRETPPLRVLRKDLTQQRFSARLPYLFGFAGAVLLILWFSGDPALTAMLVLSVAGTALVLGSVSFLLLHSSTSMGLRAGSAWRLAMSAARRRRKQNVLQILVFSITIMSLLVLTLLRTDLIDEWQAQLPEDTPNHFLMNIAAEQIDGIESYFTANEIESNPFFPLISARIVAINDADPQPRAEEDRGGTVAETGREGNFESDGAPDSSGQTSAGGTDSDRDGRSRLRRRQVTWTAELPPDNQITAGEWWGENAESGLVSIDQEYADWLGINLGDRLEFDFNSQSVSADVASLRSVNWDNLQPNFFIIFSPGTIDHLVSTHLSTARLEQQQKLLLNELIRLFPTIVVIEIDALIEQIQNIIAQVTSAIELIFVLVIACGALVLLSCVNATLDERFRENAILRTLGAGRRLIMTSLLLEFATIGLVSGLIATAGAEASLYYLQEEVFAQDFRFHPWVWLAGPLTGLLLIATLGVLSTRRVVRVSPINVLRQLS